MARLGLEPGWRVIFANDCDPGKAACYAAAFGGEHLRVGDVAALHAADLPGRARLAWASFPCQDLSLAGARAGLGAKRSGTFWSFWRLMGELQREGRAPPLLVLENVRGLLTARGGGDFLTLVQEIASAGYRVGAVEIDASWFTPQSRPRVFVIAAKSAPPPFAAAAPGPGHPLGVLAAHAALSERAQRAWVWWRLPPPPRRNADLADIVDGADPGSSETAAQLLALMSPLQIERLAHARRRGARVGAAFRRVRVEDGVRRQRLEARFDGLAGCLRTPAGGSSRQFVLFLGRETTTARLLAPREAARLMGLPETYPLPSRANAALHLLGDGVCVPAVRWLSDHLLVPLARSLDVDAARPAA